MVLSEKNIKRPRLSQTPSKFNFRRLYFFIGIALSIFLLIVIGALFFPEQPAKPSLSPPPLSARSTPSLKWHYIGKTGAPVIPNLYDGAQDFSEGLAAVQVNKKWGFIDKAGQIAIPPAHDLVGDFSEGLTWVSELIDTRSSTWRSGYIDKTGRFLAPPPQFQGVNPFHEGLAAVNHNGRYGYINRTGQMAIPAEFDFATQFSDGLAAVRLNNKWGYLDNTGRLIIPFRLLAHTRFWKGVAAVQLDDRTHAFIDNTGRVLSRTTFPYGLPYMSPEPTPFLNIDLGKWGHIDKTGQQIIPPKYDEVGFFHEGLASVRLNKKWGYIDSSDGLVIPFQFDSASQFADGLAGVLLDGKWGYIDNTGRFVIPPQFHEARRFVDGIAAVGLKR